MNLRRTLLLVVFLGGLSAVLTGALWQLQVSRDEPAPDTTAGATSGEPPTTVFAPSMMGEGDALAILARWDERRAAAYAHGDVRALRGLYLPGSVAGRHDVAMLQEYIDRGLRVRGMRTQVLAAEVRSRKAAALTLVVTDRLAGATAVGRGEQVALPHDAPTTRTISLRRIDDAWLVDEVR